MFLIYSFYVALVIFGFGLLYKISAWFRYDVGIPEVKEISSLGKVFTALKGIIQIIFSAKIIILLRVFLLDVLLQMKILRESSLRWVMHIFTFAGFMGLLLTHALGNSVTYRLFPDFYSTLNPFLFLRNLFACLVIVGLAIAAYRRLIQKPPLLMNNMMDRYVLIILAVIMLSGVLLESTKIVSYKKYQSMVEDYADVDDEGSLMALESYWAKEFGVVSPNLEQPFEENLVRQGYEIHEGSCASCHSKPQWAFLSYGMAKSTKPFARVLERVNFESLLLYIHLMACFFGLAYLPFSKMFHIFSSPLSLLANAVMDNEAWNPVNIATKQIMELDACTHCGACTLRCAVGACFEQIPNLNILPSEKIRSLKAFVAGKKLSQKEVKSIQEGLYLCTNCYRCTGVCPVGINLQDLWFNVREALLQRGYAELVSLSPLSLYRALRSDRLMEEQYRKPLLISRKAIGDKCNSFDSQGEAIDLTHISKGFKRRLANSVQGNTFTYCFTCTTCTSACPVVRSYYNRSETLGLVPHQIIRAAALGLTDLIFNSNMLWNCLGCYQCQENCPQGVKVTDILYELKNMTFERLNGGKPDS